MNKYLTRSNSRKEGLVWIQLQRTAHHDGGVMVAESKAASCIWKGAQFIFSFFIPSMALTPATHIQDTSSLCYLYLETHRGNTHCDSKSHQADNQEESSQSFVKCWHLVFLMPSGTGQELDQCQSAVLNQTPAVASRHSVTVTKCSDRNNLEEEMVIWLILQITAYHWGK